MRERNGSGSGSGTAVDCGVGSVVWVQRRNGSWWPGQIIATHELDSSHLMSARAGTPVKLLGRKDACVDWCDLEKSKRVKPFRCDEFDACIKRVEASLGMPIKKREKHARREDAIVHALGLERQIMKNQGKLEITSDPTMHKLANAVEKDLLSSPAVIGNNNGTLGEGKSCQSFKQPGDHYNNDISDGPFLLEKDGNGNQFSIGEHTEVTPLMRGLQDIGPKTSTLKEKFSTSTSSSSSMKLIVDDNGQPLSSSGPSMGSQGPVQNKNSHEKRKCLENGLHDEHSPKKRAEQLVAVPQSKRSRYAYLQPESSDSLDYKETHPQAENSGCPYDGESPRPSLLIGGSAYVSVEENESDSLETHSSDSESDSSETEPDIDMGMAVFSVDQNVEDDESTSNDEVDELAISGDMPHLYPRDRAFSNDAVSKWQLKGKRNTRNLTKRPATELDVRHSLYGPYLETKQNRLNHRAFGHDSKHYWNDFGDGFDEAGFGWNDAYFVTSRAAQMRRGLRSVDCEEWSWGDQPMLKGRWDCKSYQLYNGNHPFVGKRSILINVDVKVQSSYQKGPVPIVSLMSKLDGKAIIGHPIQIETLQDGSSESLVPSINDFDSGSLDGDGTIVLPQAWRTARRTANFRVPRPHLSSPHVIDGGSDDLDQEQDRKWELQKLNGGSSSHKGSPLGKNAIQADRPAVDKNFRKATKKGNMSSNKKIRTLSSLAVEHNFLNKPMHSSSRSNSYITNGLIKPEVSGPLTVACIPVKLVFSRLLEKINRPPSSKAASSLVTSVERNTW